MSLIKKISPFVLSSLILLSSCNNKKATEDRQLEDKEPKIKLYYPEMPITNLYDFERKLNGDIYNAYNLGDKIMDKKINIYNPKMDSKNRK